MFIIILELRLHYFIITIWLEVSKVQKFNKKQCIITVLLVGFPTKKMHNKKPYLSLRLISLCCQEPGIEESGSKRA